jgi:hypothetical protein
MASALLAAPLSWAAGTSLASLPAPARDLATASMEWMDRYYDDAARLCRSPYPGAQRHTVRDSTWYAVGLFLRNGKGDSDRALRIVDAVLDQQFDQPNMPFHGTFATSPEAPKPVKESPMWRGYDPNWRQFIGTIWGLMLLDYGDRIPPALRKRMEASLRLAIAGEERHGRLKASYTNISLMHAWMLDFAGKWMKDAEYTRKSEAWANDIHELFRPNRAFQEYNAPTYYGVDLYALALWRTRARSPRLRKLGAEMEADLWRDIGRFYHAGLRNLAGPYTRTYGMDMPSYVALTGLWFWERFGRKGVPFPMPDEPGIFTSQDFMWGPVFALIGTKVPTEVGPHLERFQGERQVQRVILDSPLLVATAWLGNALMLGAESTSGTRGAGGQFAPVTAHWRRPDGARGWVRLMSSPPVDARASKDTIEITTAKGDSVFHINDAGTIARDAWALPGLAVKVETNAATFDQLPAKPGVEVRYRGATRIVLRFATDR